MKNLQVTILVLLLLTIVGSIHAQNVVLSTGAEASGTNGTASYSVGQVAYTTEQGSAGSSAQGVQQPYEIYIATGTEETTINLRLSAYPNPTRDLLTLSVDAADQRALSYQLYDMQGRKLMEGAVVNMHTTLSLSELPVSTYFLKIIDQQQAIKSFKIIKS